MELTPPASRATIGVLHQRLTSLVATQTTGGTESGADAAGLAPGAKNVDFVRLSGLTRGRFFINRSGKVVGIVCFAVRHQSISIMKSPWGSLTILFASEGHPSASGPFAGRTAHRIPQSIKSYHSWSSAPNRQPACPRQNAFGWPSTSSHDVERWSHLLSFWGSPPSKSTVSTAQSSLKGYSPWRAPRSTGPFSRATFMRPFSIQAPRSTGPLRDT